MSEFDDPQLMEQISAGQVEALSELYARYSERAYKVAVSFCGDGRRAQDVVQAVFVAVWKSRASYRPQAGTIAAWLLISVRDRCNALSQRNSSDPDQRLGDDSLKAHPKSGSVEPRTHRRERADQLRVALAQLPKAQQEVIVLARDGQLSHSEIAAELGLPADAVKGRMRLGLHQLKRSLEQARA